MSHCKCKYPVILYKPMVFPGEFLPHNFLAAQDGCNLAPMC